MKRIKNKILLFTLICFSGLTHAQKQEAETLADQFWQLVKADSSAFVIKNALGHEKLDAVKLSETLLAAGLNFGKPSVIDRKGYRVFQSTGGTMGKGQYVCFNYRNKYKDGLLGENLVFEKLVFYRKNKTDTIRLVHYAWSKRGIDISCD